MAQAANAELNLPHKKAKNIFHDFTTLGRTLGLFPMLWICTHCGKYCIILPCVISRSFFVQYFTCPISFALTNTFDILVLTWIRSAPPHLAYLPIYSV
jgi:hypothetical protein